MNKSETQRGVIYGLMAYLSWGVFPLYWKLLKRVPHLEVLGHRMLWGAIFLLVLLAWKQGRQIYSYLLISRNYLKYLLLSATFITFNWFIYIYAVNSDQVLESSLGYFISPLVTVLLGAVVLKEYLKPMQKFAVVLAALGVILLSVRLGRVPYLALMIATSFGLYGLTRKKIPLEPMVASSVEALIQVVPAMMILGYCARSGGVAERSMQEWGYLIVGGIVTALPLLWFANAVKRLPLSLMGFLQYVSPTLQFALAVGFFGEPFTATHLQAFACIWTGLVLWRL